MIALLFLACSPTTRPATTAEVQASAEVNAKTFATSLGIPIEGAACSGQDTNHNGYVSCMLNENGHLEPVQCGYDVCIDLGESVYCKSNSNMGCKIVP